MVIRLALIGLSTSSTTSWAKQAHLPYLLSERGRSKYQILAICNTSVESAQKAIKAFNLPSETRAYGSAEDLADDKDVDLVVCSTRVDTHADAVRPSLLKGKQAFVEWPLAGNIDSIRELVGLATASGAKTAVGIQGRLAPVALAIKDLLKEGNLGKVLSSEARASGGTMDRELLAAGLTYFTDLSVGGNMFTIGFAHLFDTIQSVVGEVGNIQTRLQLQRPAVKLRDPQTGDIVGTTTSDVPDLVVAHGLIQASDIAEKGATLSIRFRRGQPFKGEPSLSWHINCEKGEIRLTNPGSSSIGADSYKVPVTIDVHDFASDEVRRIEWGWPAWQEEAGIPTVGRSIAAVYEAFADGKTEAYADFEGALKRHEQLHEMLSGWNGGT